MDETTAQQYVADVLDTESPVKGHSLVRLVCATQQVVSGMLYKLVAQVSDVSGETQECSFKIHSQPWKQNGETVEIQCDRVPKVSVPITLTRESADGVEARRKRGAYPAARAAASAKSQALLEDALRSIGNQHAAIIQ